MNYQAASSPLRALALALTLAGLVSGCSVMDVKKDTLKTADQVKTGPENAPFRAITNFSPALRCMDTAMIDFGVRDVSMLVEELADQTKKVNAGTRDMLISAVSDMTKRSRGIRLIAFGRDSGNLVGFYEAAGSKNPYATIPQFDIKGSISQFDENIAKKTAEAGFAIGEYLSAGYAKSANATVLGIDLTVLDTADMSVVPGVTSRNAVIIYKQGSGLDADAQYKKFGINFSTTLSKSEGNTQALRNLVELAAIELIGKLTRLPYWKCLGADAQGPEVRQEIQDWFDTLTGPNTIAYFQYQLRLRGYYNGPVDGQPGDAFIAAVIAYRQALGLSAEAKLDLDFYAAYLNGDHHAIKAKAKVAGAEPVPPAEAKPDKPSEPAAPTESAKPLQPAGPSEPAQPVPPRPALSLVVANLKGTDRFARGELINLTVTPTRDSHVYCYLQDETRAIQRFYPNRFRRDSFVKAGEALQLPGQMRFQLLANTQGVKETVACFASERDVFPDLPQAIAGQDFEKVPVASLEAVRDAFKQASKGVIAEGYFHVDVQ